MGGGGGGGFLDDEADGGLDGPSQQESWSEFLAVKTQVSVSFLPKKTKTTKKNKQLGVVSFCVNNHLVSQLNTKFDSEGVSVAKTGHCFSYSIIIFPAWTYFSTSPAAETKLGRETYAH